MTVAAAAAGAAARGRRQVARDLREAGALSADAALPYAPPSRLAARALERMLRDGVVRETGAGVYWLDEPAYAARLAAFRRRALVLLAAATTIMAAAVLFAISRS